MCGIVGIYGRSEPETLSAMLETIVHRGPDEDGTFHDLDTGISMGARRLSIVDLQGGSQPMRNESGDVVVVFNGEIYNHQRLRSRLEESGHTFRTDCDTEVLVHLWEEHGEVMVEHLNGMFAFSLWDRDSEQLFIARDRLGIKPLFYADTDDGFYWGSEVVSLLAAGIERTIDEQAVYNYLSLKYTPWSQTLLSKVEKVPPGTSLLVSEDGVSERRFWRPSVNPVHGSRSRVASKLRSRLEDAVDRRMMADVPIGSFLSGGLDSTAIVGLLSERSSEPVDTYSVGFQGDQYDESSEAAFVADHFGTDHHEVTVDLSSMDIFESVVRQFGEPLADPAALPTMLLAERAGRDLKTVLTGEGADELFAGYDQFRMLPNHRRKVGWVPQSVLNAVGEAERVSPFDKEYFRYLSSLGSDQRAILHWIRGYGTRPEAYADTDESPETSGLVSKITGSWDGSEQDTLQRLTAYYVRHWLSDDLLYKVDHATMAHSLEARVPYLDHELVKFALGIPTEYKLDEGYKPILNRAVSDIVPSRTRRRDKQGFRVPVSRWFREDHESIQRWLSEEHLGATPYLDSSRVFDLWDEHRRERADHGDALWKILNYTAWYDVHIDSVP